MKSINIVECKNEDDLKEVAILAEKIWHEFFPGIISEAQIDYMVEQFQSFDAMQDQSNISSIIIIRYMKGMS